MSTFRIPKPIAVLTILLAITTTASAEDPRKPQTTGDPKVAVDELTARLRPLTKAELTVEADGWFALVRGKIREISELRIQMTKATAEQKVPLAELMSKLTEERAEIVDRMNAVLAALKAKGGAAADYETYLSAVSESPISTADVTDVSTFSTMALNWIKSPQGGLRYGKNILLFIGVLVVFRVLAGTAATLVRRAMVTFRNSSQLLCDFMANATQKILMFVGFVVALSMLEVNIGPFLAAMGAAGFIIGFALQGTLSNFAAGVMLLLYRPYDIGDKVIVAGQNGNVVSMNLVSTVLTNADGHTVTIPNSSIWGGTITNQTTHTTTLGTAATPAK